VLAVVDDLAGAGMLIGRGAAAEVGAALEEGDAVTGFSERAGGGETRQASANDGDGCGSAGVG
jgi:hypothetical protein